MFNNEEFKNNSLITQKETMEEQKKLNREDSKIVESNLNRFQSFGIQFVAKK